MAGGELEPPNLDDRTWSDLVQEARALIPQYAPDWTDHNPSDLGMTLVELFAWLVEQMIYRLNRVPEKSHITFLKLLGITRAPAEPAVTWLTYRLAPDAQPVTVRRGSRAATQQTEQVEGVVFETDEDLLVLPIELSTALLIEHDRVRDVSRDLICSPFNGASISVPAANLPPCILVLGFDKATTEPLNLLVLLGSPAEPDIQDRGGYKVEWCYSTSSTPPTQWTLVPGGAVDGTSGLQRSGTVVLKAPNDWEQQQPERWGLIDTSPLAPDIVTSGRYWLGLRITSKTLQAASITLKHLLFNSVSATSALSTGQQKQAREEPDAPELWEQVGTSDGQAFQVFDLAHRPLYRPTNGASPLDRLDLRVAEALVSGGFGGWESWMIVDDLPAGPVKCARLDPVTGTLLFGDCGSRDFSGGHGLIPRKDSKICVVGYRYVADGARANVPPGTVTILRKTVTQPTDRAARIVGVTNLRPAAGGADEEPQDKTLRRAATLLRTRSRAVTTEDYEYFAVERSQQKSPASVALRLAAIGPPASPGTLAR